MVDRINFEANPKTIPRAGSVAQSACLASTRPGVPKKEKKKEKVP
jgi:hypothetical protein